MQPAVWHVTVDQNWAANIAEYRFVAAWLEHAPGAVLVSAAIVPIVQTGGAFWIGATAAIVATRWAGGFTPGLFAAVSAVALARWAGLG